MNLRTNPSVARRTNSLMGGAMGVLVLAGLAAGQPESLAAGAPAAPAPEVASSGDPVRDNFIRMARPISIKFEQQRLEDIIKYIGDFTGADLEVMWVDERHSDGLDPEQTITLEVKNVSALTLLEGVLEKSRVDDEESTWQLGKYGAIQAGPKSRLNKFRRTEIYDINDLLVEIPRYDEVPSIDLQSVLQSGQGGGGQSPFRDDNEQEDTERKSLKDKADEVVTLIEKIVEPEQWVDNGGEAAAIDQFRGTLIVTAPDYVHRQINGYPWWPSAQTRSGMANGRRWVSLNMDTGQSTLDGMGQQPVTAVVNGQLVPSNGPGGGR